MRKNTFESGHSLVEMLGVLAIIGVLSVGGIASFNVAMTKHKANELLNESNRRAVEVFSQSLKGNTKFSFSDMKNDLEYATFDPTEIDIVDGQFTITIIGVASNICTQMKNITSRFIQNIASTPADCSGTTNTMNLTYNERAIDATGVYDPNSPEVQQCVANGCQEPNRCLPNGEE